MLNRKMAPISDKVWEEIDNRAREVLTSYLTARRVVRVNGPMGLEFNAIGEGRLSEIKKADSIHYSNYDVKPLTEVRVEFELDRKELDDIVRGAKDPDLEPLEDALKKLALFEEKAVYYGLEDIGIVGLDKVGKKAIPFGKDRESILNAIGKGLMELKEAYTNPPYVLVVGEEQFKDIILSDNGYPLEKKIAKLIGGEIIVSKAVNGAFLVPFNSEDLELTIGQDFAIGFVEANEEKIKLFAIESFTFRVLNPDIVVKFA
ncbi:MAG: bacteriocin family protein [Tissierellales bacterium]|nr:bacteriocin family protein [Tissierellales bacterium]